MKISFCAACLVTIVAGCSGGQTIKELRYQNDEFKAYVAWSTSAIKFDLQARCASEAKDWFEDDFSSDEDTMVLNFANHYNKEQNKCFVVVELHEANSVLQPGAWTNDRMLWDIYENAQLGEVVESNVSSLKPGSFRSEVTTCYVLDKKCTTVNEFDDLVRTYMSK